jgi:GNAT superfamily N-acetyltransferase
MKLTIRKIGGMDIGPLREMAIGFHSETTVDYPVIDEREIDKHMLHILATKDSPDSMYLIAYDGKKPAGYFVGYIGTHEWSRPARVAVAQELYVVPNKRGGKVGLRLMQEAGKLAIQLGAEGFESIGTYNDSDKRWEKFGFKPHLTYGHMEPTAFMELVNKFTRRAA